MWPDKLAMHSMALTVQLQLNPRTKPFVLMVKANKLLQHRRGKRDEGEAPASKHQTQLGRVRWRADEGRESRTLLARPKPQRKRGQELKDTSICVQNKSKNNEGTCQKKRRRGRAGRRAARRQASTDRDRARRRELVTATITCGRWL